MSGHTGQHRMGWREAATERWSPILGPVEALWHRWSGPLRIWRATRKSAAAIRVAAQLPPVCETCIHNRHRECGLFLEDTPCGCSCPNARRGRDGGVW